MKKAEVEVTYQPVINFNKYGLTIRKVVEFKDTDDLTIKIKTLQTYIRKRINEQINVDRVKKIIKGR